MQDHRIDRTKAHSMESIVFISMAAVLCGADTWEAIERFGNLKREWIAQHIDLSAGVPSHDTFNRFFSSMDPGVFEDCFRKWVQSLSTDKPDILSVDGKTIRGSRGVNRSPLHMVSCWSNNNQMSIGQIRTAEKSNEITAVPELLESLLITGSIVTIDAMGCQQEIVKKITEKEADYVIAVKGNQPELYDDIQDSFRAMKGECYESSDSDHGRIETRRVYVLSDTSLVAKASNWAGLRSLVKVESERYTKATGQTETSSRYYISSLPSEAEKIAHAIRCHWGIENNLHWMLDVAFNEDGGRKRNENAVQNFSLLNKIALKMLTDDKSKGSIKTKRLSAGWDNSFLEQLMGI